MGLFIALHGGIGSGKTSACLGAYRILVSAGYRPFGWTEENIRNGDGIPISLYLKELGSDRIRFLGERESFAGAAAAGGLPPFRFEMEVFREANDAFVEALERGRRPLFLDEIGRLELEREAGFMPALAAAALADDPLAVLCVHDRFLGLLKRRLNELGGAAAAVHEIDVPRMGAEKAADACARMVMRHCPIDGAAV